MLVDSHCHLDFPDFAEELPEVIARAGRAGVGRMVSICTHLSRFDQVKAIAEQYDEVYCSVGIHPHEAGQETLTSAADLVALTQHPKVVGIGETGLDYFYDHSPRDVQQRAFRLHIAAARESGLPVIVHTRDAEDDTLEMLADEMRVGAYSGLIHCFSSSAYLAEKALEMGLYISLSGIVTFNKAEDLRQTVKKLPLDRLLVETDSPYLAPVPKRGKRNEPAYTVHTAAKVAEVLGLSNEELAEATTENFFKLFTKMPRPSAV